MNDKIKYILSVIGGFIATATKQYGLILLFVAVAINPPITESMYFILS